MALEDRRHPEAERLAEYADGVLEVQARAAVEQHLADCADCRAVVMETMAFLDSNLAIPAGVQAPKVVPFRSRRWVTGVVVTLAAAAALVLAIRVARPEWVSGLFGPRGDRPELQELIAAVANESTRPVEGRLSGGFKYAPPPSPTRGPGDREVSPDVRIAAAKIEKRAREHDHPRNLADAGLAYLALGDFDKGVTYLDEATRQEPGNPQFQSDLAAAYLARAKWTDRAEDLPRALAACERAIAASPTMVEPQFNRALALDALHLDDQAVDAWNGIRDREASSPWATEARARINALSKSISSLGSRTTRDDNQTRRERLEDQLLVARAEAVLHSDWSKADNLIDQVAREAELLASDGGDTMIRDEVELIRIARTRSDVSALRLFADGHKRYGDARRFYLGEKLGQATTEMAGAAEKLHQVGSAYQWWAPVYAAIAGRMGTSTDRLVETLKQIPIDQIPASYFHLRGRYLWTEGLGLETLGQIDIARDRFRGAAALFLRGGEIENLAATSSHAAEATWLLGDRAGARRDELVALAPIGRIRVSTRRNVVLLTAAFFALSQDLPETALNLQNSLVRSIEGDESHVGAPDARICNAQGSSSVSAITAARCAIWIAPNVRSPIFRTRSWPRVVWPR